MRLLLSVTTVLLVFAACKNKDIRLASDIQGQWQISSFVVQHNNGAEELAYELLGMVEFTKCDPISSENHSRDNCAFYYTVISGDVYFHNYIPGGGSQPLISIQHFNDPEYPNPDRSELESYEYLKGNWLITFTDEDQISLFQEILILMRNGIGKKRQ